MKHWLILILLIGGCVVKPIEPIPAPEGRVMRAVTVGLDYVDPNAYGGWSGELPDCEFDAQFAGEMWREFGIPTKTLLTEQATIENCKQALKDSLVGRKKDDWLIVWLSGHGGQKLDAVYGDEADRLDEYVCLYDGALLDDTINDWLEKVPKGVCVLFICDTCHSGSMHRKPVIFGKRAVKDFKGQLILMSGCAESGFSMSTGQGGVWSTALHDTGPEGKTPKTWFEAAKAKVPEETQVPQYIEYGNVTSDFRYGIIIP